MQGAGPDAREADDDQVHHKPDDDAIDKAGEKRVPVCDGNARIEQEKDQYPRESNAIMEQEAEQDHLRAPAGGGGAKGAAGYEPPDTKWLPPSRKDDLQGGADRVEGAGQQTGRQYGEEERSK